MTAIERAIRAHKIALLFEAEKILDEWGYIEAAQAVGTVAKWEKNYG